MPKQVTVHNYYQGRMLPIEVAGWLMNKVGLAQGDWLLLVTQDTDFLLASQLAVRAPGSFNLTIGLGLALPSLELVDTQVQHRLLPAIREANGQLPVNYGQCCFQGTG